MAARSKVKVRESASQIAKLISMDIERPGSDANDAVDDANLKLAQAARDYWRSVSPVDTGAYRKATHIVKRPKRSKLPARRVVNNDPKAVFIEFGTGGDTPTPEFAPMGRTVIKFHGRP